MLKTNLLLACLNPINVHVGTGYIYFQDKVGEPHTIIQDGDELVVSGNQPKGAIHRFFSETACLEHLKAIGPSFLIVAY